jgi:iron complex transport system ATP-binding protein
MDPVEGQGGAGTQALQARGVCFGYDRAAPVLRDVSVTLESGTITAIVGPNGAGKSTLVRVLAGLAAPQAGTVELQGRAIGDLSPAARARRLAYIPQRGELIEAFSVRQVVALGRHGAGGGGGGTGADAVEAALARCGLGELAEATFQRLSVGQQQRVLLARAVAQLAGTTGGVLLADEPLAALDPAHAGLAAGLLREIAAAGRAVAVVVHDLTSAARIADRAVLLGCDGRMSAAGRADDVLHGGELERVFGVVFDRAATPGGPVIAARFDGGGRGYP